MQLKKTLPTNKRAFTLIEIMIVIAIIGLLSVLGFMGWRNQIAKSQDALRKKDLQRISIAFEEYYSDYGCYPETDILTNCGGNDLSPYLNGIPCDPVFSTPYCYLVDSDYPTCGKNYRLLTTLGNIADPSIDDLGCSSDASCGYDLECNNLVGRDGYNFGISSLNIPLANPIMPTPTPTPSPSSTPAPTPGTYACVSGGGCDNVGFPNSCSLSFSNMSECQTYCLNPLPEDICD